MQQPEIRVDEEDLDDLDDVLDQFTPAPPKQPPAQSPPAAPAAPAAARSTAPPSLPGADDPARGVSEDFARELARGMEALMREVGGGGLVDAAAAAGGEEEEEERKERLFRAAWEAMLVEGMDGEDATAGVRGEGAAGGTPEKDDFQKTIRGAMGKLRESESTLQADADASNSDDTLEALLAQLGGGESEEELDGLLKAMMTQLMSKEVLYEPLKELHDKFPAHLKDHPELPADEKKRYQSQYQAISKLIALFEDPRHKDDDPQVVELMTEMQSFGSPPPEIMGPMPPGFGFGADGAPQMPEGCVVA